MLSDPTACNVGMFDLLVASLVASSHVVEDATTRRARVVA
jgi:hypothetical protein